MSIDATIATWKLTKEQVTPTQKLILLSYADRANESFECWPSNKRLEFDTGFDRHTICENKKLLIDKGLISYTGEKKGRTNSIDVVRLNFVTPREGYVDAVGYRSSEEMPIAQNSSSGEMPIGSSGEMPTAKQWGNAHTESISNNLKEEPNTTTISSSNFFDDYKKKEIDSLKQLDDKFNKQKLENEFRTESLADTKAHAIYNERFKGLNVTLEELYDECVDYWKQTGQQVFKARFITHLKKTNLEKYKDYKSMKHKSSITPDDKDLIQNYSTLCRANRNPDHKTLTAINALRMRLKLTDTPEAREAIAALNKADEILNSSSFKTIVKTASKKSEISKAASESLASIKEIVK